MVETNSDWFQNIALAEDPFLPFWTAFIQSWFRDGHERVTHQTVTSLGGHSLSDHRDWVATDEIRPYSDDNNPNTTSCKFGVELLSVANRGRVDSTNGCGDTQLPKREIRHRWPIVKSLVT